MSATYKYIYDCDEILRYLNTNSNKQIQMDTAVETKDSTVSVTAINNWRHLEKNKLSQEIINALNNRKILYIATFTDIDRLCNTVSLDNTTSNAKRVFNMLFSDNNKEFEFQLNQDTINTPMAKYMTGFLKVKCCFVNYLPGRSVTLDMLYNFGKTLDAKYTKSGIVAGLKVLVDAGLAEAFKVIEKSGIQTTEQVSREEISAHNENILYKLSIKGCIEYTENRQSK